MSLPSTRSLSSTMITECRLCQNTNGLIIKKWLGMNSLIIKKWLGMEVLSFTFLLQVLPGIPKAQRNRVAHFLEKQGFKQQALAVSCDPEHRFELALTLGELKIAHELAVEAEV